MATDLISGGFWPDDIKPTIQSPKAILRPRADELTEQTKGILVGSISTAASDDGKWTKHHLDVTVPTLNNFRQRLLSLRHEENQLYPTFVDAVCFDLPLSQRIARAVQGQALQDVFSEREKENNEASSDEELVALLKQALHSHQIKSVLVNLIALSNQVNEQKNGESATAFGKHSEVIESEKQPDGMSADSSNEEKA